MKHIAMLFVLFLFLTTGLLSGQTPPAPMPASSPVFTKVEKMPEYPGGDEAMSRFMRDNVRYPAEAAKQNLQGKVYVTFVVDVDGTVREAKVLRGIGGGCDEEALRVVNMMPAWQPGTQDGKPVRVQFNLPVNFVLKDKK